MYIYKYIYIYILKTYNGTHEAVNNFFLFFRWDLIFSSKEPGSFSRRAFFIFYFFYLFIFYFSYRIDRQLRKILRIGKIERERKERRSRKWWRNRYHLKCRSLKFKVKGGGKENSCWKIERENGLTIMCVQVH